jgi:microcompartment protein CcmL/EutN
MEKRSLGLIETWGYTAAIEAADAGTKAANITLLGYEVTLAGLVTVKFQGDVGAVKAAVSAASAAAEKVGKVVTVHVIPRPDGQLRIEPSGQPPSDEPIKAEKKPTPAAPEVEAQEPPAVPEEKKAEMTEETAVAPEEEKVGSAEIPEIVPKVKAPGPVKAGTKRKPRTSSTRRTAGGKKEDKKTKPS